MPRSAYAEDPSAPTAVAYLVAAYPAVSHTFIAREIFALRTRGVRVETMSIRRAPPEQLLTDSDREEAAQTFSILPVDRGRLVRAHVGALVRNPVDYLATLGWALSLSAGGLRAGLWQLFYFAEAILVWDECCRLDVRHIHAHFANVASAVAMLAARFGRRQGMTWSLTMHGPTEFDDVTRFALAEKIRQATFVACISDYCRSQMLRLVEPEFWDRLDVIRCGLLFSTGEATEHPIAATPAVHMPLRLLSVGRLVPDKGQQMLLEALHRLRDSGISIEATLVGDGPDRARLELISRGLGLDGCVRFTGALGHDRVQLLYEASDVFCLPSFAEGLPVVLMEAMANQLAVVTTRIAGVAELVQDDVSGLLVAPGRVDQLVEAIATLVGDPARRLRLGLAARDTVRSDYDVTESAAALLARFRTAA